MHLIVVTPFGAFSKGDRLTEAAVVAGVLSSENAAHVIKVSVPSGAEEDDAPPAAESAAGRRRRAAPEPESV